MKCTRCQSDNPDGARFCTSCGAPLTKPPRRRFSALAHALLYYFLFTAVQFVVILTYEFAIAFSGAFNTVIHGGYDFDAMYESLMETVLSKLTENVNAIMILSALLTVLVLFLSFHLRHKKPLEEMHIRKISPKAGILALLFGAALQGFTAIAMAFLPIPPELIESFAENSELISGGPIGTEILNVVLVTPIIEEIIFRGLVYTRLACGFKPWAAVILSAVIFGMAHGHIISFVYAGFLGIVLVALMRKQGDSILSPILCHMGFNGASYLISMIEEITLPVVALFFFSAAAAIFLGYFLLAKAPAERDEE